MNSSDIPSRILLPFAADAAGANIRSIPLAPTGTPGQASLQLGFPPICFTALGAGGVPPAGQDFNGILNQITAWNQWQAAGGPIFFDSAFASAISGYPKGATVASATRVGLVWLNLLDGNTTDPDSTSAANWVPACRISAPSALTFYVSKTGSDTTGDGTIGSPWATVQHAVNVLVLCYDFAGQTITISRADSLLYTDATVISGKFVGQTSPLVITASAATAVTVTTASSEVYKIDVGAMVTIQNQKLVNSVGNLLYVTRESLLSHSGMNYGAATANHILADRLSNCIQTGNNTISGNTTSHVAANSNANAEINSTNTLSGTPAFTYFVSANGALINAASATFSGSATGARFYVANNGVINTNGGGASFFPGNSAGTGTNSGTSPYGLYV